MKNEQQTIPIIHKYSLSVEEVAQFTGIGTDRIYMLIRANPKARWMLKCGNKTLIKRDAFTHFLDGLTEI